VTVAAVLSPTVERGSDTPDSARAAGLFAQGVGMEFGTDAARVTALRDCSVAIAPGQRASIIGPSGCGKSTLLRIFANILVATQGEVAVGGMTPSEARKKRAYSFVFQNSVMLPWRTLRQNVELAMEVTHVDPRERATRAAALIELVGLAGFEDRYPNQLSGGMRQRGAIARALTLSPKFLLMDEPFGALDEINRERLNFELLRILSATSATLLLVTHSIPEAVILSDRVFVMTPRPGRISQVIDTELPRERTPEIRDLPQFQHVESVLRHALYGA
jgi:NitT/TauT family transport system ATP-binding protein